MSSRSSVLLKSTLVAALCGTATCFAASPHPPCQVQSVSFEGWKAQQLSNQWVKLTIVPQLGGRVMQVAFGDHPYLFVNSKLKGKYSPPEEAGTRGQWLNFGGDKIWPLPEGTQDEQHWPGPISDALDAGAYELKVLSASPICKVALQGPPDPQTGLQYAREISLEDGSPAISFHTVMKNATTYTIRWSMQTVTQYDTGSRSSPDTYNRNFWAFTPMNPKSTFVEGHHARSGPWSDPAFSTRDGLFTLHWLYFEREVWLDSTAGWLAVVDGTTRYAMVERFPHVEAEYPGKATVIFYTNGPGLEFDEKGMPRLTSSSPNDNPYYMEAEVNSPMVRLEPGETYALDTKWFPTRVGEDFKGMSDAGVIARPLTATAIDHGVQLSGLFGVFFSGKLAALTYDKQGIQIAVAPLVTVDPLENVDLQTKIDGSPGAKRVSIHLIDEQGNDRGSLGEASVSEPNSSQ